MLEHGERFQKAGAAFVKKQSRPHAALDITQPLHNFSPTIDPIRIRHPEVDSMLSILRRDGRPVALPAEHIRPGDDPFQVGDLQFPATDLVPAEHGLDGGGMALGEPEPFGVLVHDESVAVAILSTEALNALREQGFLRPGE